MSGTILATAGVTFAAICTWLTVRIINRRERWAKWTLTAAACVPLVYVLGFGPACWISSRVNLRGAQIPVIYRPILCTFDNLQDDEAPVKRIGNGFLSYSFLGAAPGWGWRGDAHVGANGQITQEWNWEPVPACEYRLALPPQAIESRVQRGIAFRNLRATSHSRPRLPPVRMPGMETPRRTYWIIFGCAIVFAAIVGFVAVMGNYPPARYSWFWMQP